MKLAAKKIKILSAIMTCVLAITLMAGFPAVKAYAASGTVYSCTLNRCYAHPVTGVIEDSGGESSYATGQGMVEGCVYSNGILEVTDDGAYYLTIRMSLMDYTSGHSFQVQNVGDSGWSTPSEIGITGNGSDSNGTTADVCMRVPSENCVVRGSMYVEPMGRDVIFYLYPSNYSEGNNTDMNATMVTAASGTDNSSNNNNNASGAASTDNTSSGNQDNSQASGSSSLQSSTGSQTSGNASLQSGTGNDKNSNSDSDNAEQSESETGSAPKLQSSITQAAAPASSSGTDSSTLNSAEGLSLSTAQDASDKENVSDTDAAKTSGSSAFQIGLAVTVAGLILIAVAAGIVYFFRRNWRRWGGGEDDEEEYKYRMQQEDERTYETCCRRIDGCCYGIVHGGLYRSEPGTEKQQ